MRLDKFTLRAQEAIQAAVDAAERSQNQQVEPEHLLMSLLEQPEGIVRPVLGKLGADVNALINDLQSAISRLPRTQGGQQYFSARLSQVFAAAQKQADAMKDEYVSTEHLLLAITEDMEHGQGRIIRQHGVVSADLLRMVQQVRGGERITGEGDESRFMALSRYCIDLTELARRGELAPVVGREEEIRRVIRVLMRRGRNSPVITGEPGVGKTAVVEGLALKIISGEVPDELRDSRLVALDFNAMIAGSKYRGELEDRLKGVLREAERDPRRVVLCVEELHTLIGGTAEHTFDAWCMLKSALGRGRLSCVGVSNRDDYEKYIEGDAAKRHYFHPVAVTQPTVEETIAILRALKEQYETHHGVRIKDSALVAAAVLSDSNIKNRSLPVKAIDVVDEAASYFRMNQGLPPAKVEQLEREIMQLEIERQALLREEDEASRARLKEIEGRIGDLRGRSSEVSAKWLNEKEAVERTRSARAEIERTLIHAENYESVGELSKAAELRYGRLAVLRQQLDVEQGRLDELRKDGSFFKDAVDEECVAAVVADWAGTSVSGLDWSGLEP